MAILNIFLCRPYYCYFPFSLGPRSCIGQAFAQVSRGLEQHLVSKHWASSGCADHGWWWAPEATLMPCALTLFSSEGRSPSMPMTGMSLKCYYKSRHPCSQGICREEQQAALPPNCPGSACLNPNPLMGITVSIPLPAKVKHTGRSWGSSRDCHRNQGWENISWRRAQARTGTEKMRRLCGQKEQFHVCGHGREDLRTAGGQHFGSVLSAHLSTSAQSALVLQSDFPNRFNT